MDMKRLVKSNQNRIFCGVCGGIAEYFNIDATRGACVCDCCDYYTAGNLKRA